MTLLPSDSWNVVPVKDRPDYKVSERCAAPGCARASVHAHHLWRRSAGTNSAWVCLAYREDRLVVGNLLGLCQGCHDAVTGNLGGHRARIWFDDEARLFRWVDDVSAMHYSRFPALKFQPPGIRAGETEPVKPEPTLDTSLANELDEGAELVQGILDPTFDDVPAVMREAAKLLRKRASRKRVTQSSDGLPTLSARKKRTWTIKVPDDMEDGYAVLDSLVDAAAEKLGRGDEKSALTRYFTIVEALVFLMQHEVSDG